MTAVKWEDPPEPQRVTWGPILAEVRTRPGMWARLRPERPMTANEVENAHHYLARKKTRGAHDVEGFRFVQRRIPDAPEPFCWAIWARFTPPEQET